MKISKKQISFDDLQEAYIDLLNGKITKNIFEDIDDDRERRYMFYPHGKTEHIYEYIQNSGTQYIKTGIISNANITRIEAHYYKTTDVNNQILFGMYTI